MGHRCLSRRSASRCTRAGGCALALLLGLVGADVTAACAQGVGLSSAAGTPAYASASGTLAFGFAAASANTSVKRDATAILPRGSEVSGPAKQLVEQLWRSSPTFRRQCARLVEAAVPIIVSFDFPGHRIDANAETVISRGPGLRAHIHLRGGDTLADERLAHEIEHILEQVDEVDLKLAVADHVHGAKLVERPGAFETSRAIAVGEQVAREVRDGFGWR